MIARLVSFCARHNRLVIAASVLAAVAGDLARRGLAGDVIPDLADPQVGVIADWMGHPAPEVSDKVTQVLTAALVGVPGAKAVRGTSMSGMAYVDVVFASAAAVDAGRAAIAARVDGARPRLPAAARLTVGPAASSTGWVFEYALTDPGLVSSALEIRRFQDDVLRPALAAIPGVAEVATVGGSVRQVRVDLKPAELRARAVAYADVAAALRALVAPGPLATDFVRAMPDLRPRAATPAEIEALPVGPPGGGIKVRDVALVRVLDDVPTGRADVAGYPAVGGIVVAKRDADIAALVDAVKRTIARESRRLPHRAADPARLDSGAAADVHVATMYDRAELATRVRRTLLGALAEEVAVVVLVILVFLLHVRSAAVPLVTLPVVLLLTFGAMWLLSVPATIMSLGGIGIALGMAVDADIVALEATHRQLESLFIQEPWEGSRTLPRRTPLGPSPRSVHAISGAPCDQRRAKIVAAAQSFAPAILTSLLITALSFLPVFAFTGETGRLLRPLALTKTLVVAAAALVAVTLAPALRDRLLRGRVIPEFSNPLTRALVRAYRPFVHFALDRPALTLATAALALLSCLPIVGVLGAEFLPRVDEGDLLFMPTTLPGVSPDEAALQLYWQDHAISQFGEVATVFGKVGRADTGTDPAPYAMAETTIRLRPRAEWPTVARRRWYSRWAPAALRPLLRRMWPEQTPRTAAELVGELDRAVRLPGWTPAWTAPARSRMDMMTTGVRTPVGIRLVSPDAGRLDSVGAALRELAAQIPGTRSATFEALGGETWIDFDADPAALARLGVDARSVRDAVDLFATGGQIGEIALDGRRTRLRLSPEMPDVQARGPADELRELTVRATGGPPNAAAAAPVPLALVGKPTYVRRPAVLRTERGQLCAYVYLDLADGVDVQGYVARAQQAVAGALASGAVALAPGERIEWIGQYDLLVAGRRRLMWIVPLVALSMLGLLYLQFRSLTEALLVLVAVPFALVGSVWTLYLLGYPLSAPVWVGLLSVVGLAMQTGVVMVVYIDEAFHRRVRQGRIRDRGDIVEAHAEGTVRRLRPKIMTVTTMAAALLPLLWADGAGAEIMRRVAAPMIGGLGTSAFLTLEVLPVLYTLWRTRQLRTAQRRGVALSSIVGAPPPWARG